MSALPIHAVVTPGERLVVEAAARHLAEALGQAGGGPRTCEPIFLPDLEALAEAPGGGIVITSLLTSLEPVDRPWPEVEASLRGAYARLCESGDPVMICTILRHVDPADDPALAERRRVRLRRLNLLATELSRELGAFVIDLDRVLADIGARSLQTDYRLGGPAAADVAAKAVALAVVANALDALEPFEVQDAARAILAAYQPAGALPEDIKPQNLMTLGSGRRRQVVSTNTDMVQENHVGWLIRQVMKRQIGPQEALSRTIKAVRRRGPRESLALLTSSLRRLIRPPEMLR